MGVLSQASAMSDTKGSFSIYSSLCFKEATGARLFEPEPKTGGNWNTGVNLKTVLNESSVTHTILDCSEEFLLTLKQLLDRVQSLEMQQPQFIEFLCEKTYFLFMKEFGEHYSISPSLHRVLYHFTEYIAMHWLSWYLDPLQNFNGRISPLINS